VNFRAGDKHENTEKAFLVSSFEFQVEITGFAET